MKRIISLIFYLITFSTIVFGQDAWEVIGDMPKSCCGRRIGCFYQTSLYLLGGYSELTQGSINRIQRYEPTNGQYGQICQDH